MLFFVYVALCWLAGSWGFQNLRPSTLKRYGVRVDTGESRLKNSGSSSRLHMQGSVLDGASSALIAAGADYASEIENAVGEEIYGPIFQAGIFLFLSGIVAAFGVAFIVSKSDAWDDLEEEYDAGKQKQLIVSDAEEADQASSSQVVEGMKEASSPPPPAAGPVENGGGDSSGVGDLDL